MAVQTTLPHRLLLHHNNIKPYYIQGVNKDDAADVCIGMG